MSDLCPHEMPPDDCLVCTVAESMEIIAALRAERDELREALKEIIDLAKARWMPVRVFRSEAQVEIDDAKYEGADECADIARKALGVSD